MASNVNFCYQENEMSKLYVLYEVERLFALHTTAMKPNYIPVPDNGKYCGYECNNSPVAFVSVKSLTPAMYDAFQCEEKESVARLNGAVYDYAVNIVKELVVDSNVNVARKAINIAHNYRIYSMSHLPCNYRRSLREMNANPSSSRIEECGKMLHNAIL